MAHGGGGGGGGADVMACKQEEEEVENKAAWLLGIKTLKIQPYHLPPLGSLDVKVRIKALGICGSDVHHFKVKIQVDPVSKTSGYDLPDHFLIDLTVIDKIATDHVLNVIREYCFHDHKTMRCASFVVKKPMVIGHECAGIIEEVGSGVKSLAVGDRVALEPGISCRRCNLCKEGRYNLCPEMKFFGSPPTNGSLANKVVHPANLCFKLPDNVSLEEGAMCEPLSVGVHACRRAQIGPETNVLIMGAGPIGLITLLVSRAFGAPRVVIVDVDDRRLSIAKNLGADEIIHVSTNIQDVDEEVIKIQDAMGSGIDVSFDCVGYNKTMTTALNATQSGGKVCLIGLALTEMTVPLTPSAAREVDVIGIFRYRNTWPLCIEFLKSGKIDVKPLITHRFRFSQGEVEQAFETSAGGGNAIKVMFNL
ncbi:hypothetical protein POTOM_042502 [Populus tomentosa]|uniref:Enoyl reductase (ER) domain-containing protein n=1 Tax=Populus tomentosa TaxID=118781 RepID=A0A8X7YJN3_POPTO|nr:hypothetical protein POTOM_042502 [Populus tomentosa]